MESFYTESIQSHARNNPAKFEVLKPSINAVFQELTYDVNNERDLRKTY